MRSDATYLDHLGTRIGKEVGDLIMSGSVGYKIPIPIPSELASDLLATSIEDLDRQGHLDWSKTPGFRQDVFIKAWTNALCKTGAY